MSKVHDLIYNIKKAGVHAHGAGKGERAGFLRSKFDDGFTSFGEEFFDIESGDGEGARTGLNIFGNKFEFDWNSLL